MPAGEKLCQQLCFYAFKLYPHHLSPTACRNFEKGLKKLGDDPLALDVDGGWESGVRCG